MSEESDNGWLYGFLDGAEGWFPKTYCEIIPFPSDLELEAYTDSSSVATIAERPLSEEKEARTEELRLASVKLYMEKTVEYAQAEEKRLRLDDLYMERRSEYAQMIQEFQIEKCQRIVEYAAHQWELDRLQEKHERDRELNRQEREEYEQQRKEFEQRMQELLEAQKMAEAGRAREDEMRVHEIQHQSEAVLV